MYLVAIAWGYVVLMMAAAEATGPNGTLLGAVITFVMYGVLPLSIVLYVLGTPARRRALRQAEAAQGASAAPVQPDGSDHAAGDAVAPERKEP
jgi:membrane protein implicated in regulation of membrane protease activity